MPSNPDPPEYTTPTLPPTPMATKTAPKKVAVKIATNQPTKIKVSTPIKSPAKTATSNKEKPFPLAFRPAPFSSNSDDAERDAQAAAAYDNPYPPPPHRRGETCVSCCAWPIPDQMIPTLVPVPPEPEPVINSKADLARLFSPDGTDDSPWFRRAAGIAQKDAIRRRTDEGVEERAARSRRNARAVGKERLWNDWFGKKEYKDSN
ncbi:hypothetical protein EDC01DRAFT_636013 [Geopyxis carbonaria]|nr:hypothetical protein EDC01DRAFT_636013 [Geopyxis carbonaria]